MAKREVIAIPYPQILLKGKRSAKTQAYAICSDGGDLGSHYTYVERCAKGWKESLKEVKRELVVNNAEKKEFCTLIELVWRE